MKIEFESEYEYKIEVEYLIRREQKYYHGVGKSFPEITQCIIKRKGILLGFGEVVRNHLDKHNVKYACVYATKKIIHKIKSKKDREKLWNLLFEKLKEYENTTQN